MAAKKQVASATVATPAVDVAALMAMVQALQAQVASATSTAVTAMGYKPQANAGKAVKVEKPKAQFDAKKLVSELSGKPGVIEEKTQKGRRKLTAFCADGSIVSVIL